jgi:hypothetical protein
MIKQFSAGDITVRPFQTFKNWNVQSVVSGALDRYGYETYFKSLVEINEGIKFQASFSINDPVNPSGKYKRVVYGTTDAMFYRNKNNPVELFGLEVAGADPFTGKKEIRNLHERFTSMKIAQSRWGEKIKPNTIRIVDNSNLHQTYNIFDDGLTNLYITGSYFNHNDLIQSVKTYPPPAYWDTGSGQFTYTHPNGEVEILSVVTAKEYMALGLNVDYTEESGSWKYNTSGAIDIFEPSSEHFGESVDLWDRYLVVGSPMDYFNLSSSYHGYSALFKYDESRHAHRLMRRFHSPFSYEGIVDEYGSNQDTIDFVISGGYISPVNEDGYGTSVSIDDGFLAVGSPLGSTPTGSQSGIVCVYHKNKGGIDNWGIINVLEGNTYDDLFGQSVSLDEDILAVGAPGVSGSIGAVYIYRKKIYEISGSCYNLPTSSLILPYPVPTYISGNYTWVAETCLTSSMSQNGDRFGWCLKVNNNRILVGCYSELNNGFATLYTCSYYSASVDSCPTASWGEYRIYTADESNGDLKISPEYATEMSLPYDGFGMSVAMDGDNFAIGSYFDKGFVPYNGAPSELEKILGAVYFYNYRYVPDCDAFDYVLIKKTFGDETFQRVNNFGRAIDIDGTRAAVSYESDTVLRNVYYDSGSGLFTIEGQTYQSSGSEDAVLGRVGLYTYNPSVKNWESDTILRQNKENNNPYNLYGKSISISSGYLAVGAPIYNLANSSSASLIVDPYVQSASHFPYNYTGSVFLYDYAEYNKNPYIGNVFYKNGYVVMTNTSSNFYDIFTMSGSRGFDMKYQGTHTIYEHEYLVSIKPGEFNYTTNPSALISNPLLFDVNQDGVFDLYDVDFIMRYLNKKRFQDESVYFDNGLTLEQDTLNDYSWWGNDLLQTEAEDVLLLESEYQAFFSSGSYTIFTKKVFDYIETNLVNTGILDIDGNGEIDLRDGALLVAYFTNKLTPSLLQAYIDENSTRRYVNDIINYLDRYCGKKSFNVDPNFFNYQLSSSYDRTGSYLAPYITTIGLYDEDGELAAIGKLGKPIKNLIDWPINIVVRFDT